MDGGGRRLKSNMDDIETTNFIFPNLGTCFPDPVSEKKVLKLSSPPAALLSEGIKPSG